jgi:hypothetical protein
MQVYPNIDPNLASKYGAQSNVIFGIFNIRDGSVAALFPIEQPGSVSKPIAEFGRKRPLSSVSGQVWILPLVS